MSTPSRPSVEDMLLSPDQVIDKYPKLLSLSSIGRLSVRLAYESYFGKQIVLYLDTMTNYLSQEILYLNWKEIYYRCTHSLDQHLLNLNHIGQSV